MSTRRKPKFSGLLPVLKHSGLTSHDVVDIARRALGERRIGHTGTLDPMAEGVLLLCVGYTTRLQQYLLKWEKRYQGAVRLGHATTTYDIEGEPTEPSGRVPQLDDARLDELKGTFTGRLQQVPPPYSAKKIGGKKLYELAREGESIDVEPKDVVVQRLELDVVDDETVEIDLTCSSGFYVRSLAHDIGVALGCGAHLVRLQRTAVGPYLAHQSLDQEALASSGPGEIIDSESWVPLSAVQLPFPEVVLNPTTEDRFRHGGEIVLRRDGRGAIVPGGTVAIRNRRGDFLGMGTVVQVMARGRMISLKPKTVLNGG